MERHKILETLLNDVTTAREGVTAADKVFMSIVREVPARLAHPDGMQRIHNLVRELNSARHKMVEAEARFHAFIVEGVVPDDMN